MIQVEFTLIYLMAGLSTLGALGVSLDGKVPRMDALVVSIATLAVGWWKVLFWNPIVRAEVSPEALTLHFRRGSDVRISREELEAIEEYRFGFRVKWTGLRFRTRSGVEHQTSAVDRSTREGLARTIAAYFGLTVTEHKEGLRHWTA